ncbi:MAG: hypothetical protein GW823_01315 [Bacteroidetes bacterium]|nr:hypothetical protein [Bacteroidota bacterium]
MDLILVHNMFSKTSKILVFCLSCLILQSCNIPTYEEKDAEEVFYITMSDTLKFNYGTSSDSNEYGDPPTTDFKVRVYETPFMGFSEINKVYRLKEIIVDSKTKIFIPILKGETKIMREMEKNCFTCWSEPTHYYYTTYYVVITE